MFIINKDKRQIIITKEDNTKSTIVINENDSLNRKFLDGTQDKYQCILKLIDVDILNPETGEKTGEKETKAFAQKVGNPNWLMEFVEEEYNIE